jgi:hypothetical protein
MIKLFKSKKEKWYEIKENLDEIILFQLSEEFND